MNPWFSPSEPTRGTASQRSSSSVSRIGRLTWRANAWTPKPFAGARSSAHPAYFKDPRELGRLGEDPVGGQHEAREVLRNVRARWGQALW
jgi:hypothetical protein